MGFFYPTKFFIGKKIVGLQEVLNYCLTPKILFHGILTYFNTLIHFYLLPMGVMKYMYMYM